MYNKVSTCIHRTCIHQRPACGGGTCIHEEYFVAKRRISDSSMHDPSPASKTVTVRARAGVPMAAELEKSVGNYSVFFSSFLFRQFFN